MIWIISDTHFGHENIVKYTKRPFKTVEEMNEIIIRNWNNKIRKNDTIYHLGDFAVSLTDKEYMKLVKTLNGNIILVRGNHDRIGKKKLFKFGFKDVVKRIKVDNYILTHKPIKPQHLKDGIINIHGHIHNHCYTEDYIDTSNYVNVSIEVMDYEPIKFEKLKREIKNGKI